MGLFTKDELSKINRAARVSNSSLKQSVKPVKSRKGAKADIDEMSRKVEEYFSDSEAILITSVEELHDYVTKCLEAGYCGIDTETTGLDRINDTVVGFSLYYPGGRECYVPNNHLIYIFDEPCKGQLTYEQCQPELQRLVDGKCKMIFANADYDIAMIYKDFHVDFCDVCYYDVILAWRVLKENEPRNGLKELYSKYVLKGKGDPKKFSDFFSVDLFPYCKPQVAKLYAANDAKITYELFRWQLPYTVKSNPKCQKNHLERLADIIWNIEFPMIKVCALMHRNGIYFDPYVAEKVRVRYHNKYDEELADLREMVNDLVHDLDTPNNKKRPFKTGYDFIPTSPKHVQYLCYDLLKLPDVSGKKSTDKGLLRDFGLPQTDKILAVRSLSTLINSFVDKLIKVSQQSDGRVHAQFHSVGASTGRMSSSEPNCISGRLPVKTVNGLIPIRFIRKGDVVYCRDSSGGITKGNVLNSWYKGTAECFIYTFKSIDGSKRFALECTVDHKVWTNNRGFVAAEHLTETDECVAVSENNNVPIKVRLVAVRSVGIKDVYDIEVDVYHNFLANGVVVSNCQNIPSHATDIRHMFRATPEKDVLISSEDGKFTLKYYDRIKTPDGFIPVGTWSWQSVVVVRDGVEVEEHCSVSSDSSDTCTVEVYGGACSLPVEHPEYVMFSSDYSQQEPKMLAFTSQDKTMVDAYTHGKDIYATIASLAFNKPYEQCLEFNPETGEYQAEGKERRSSAKSIVLGITYGRSTVTIGEQLFGRDKSMSDEEKTKRAQDIYDAVLHNFPALKGFMQYAQDCARTQGYTETILGRRRHIPDMQLPRFEFKAMPGYVNPDVDPLDVSTLQDRSEIPQRVVNQLEQEFSKLKYYGQIVKRTKELRAQNIRVINNSRKITDATRQCVNCVDYDTEILTSTGWKKHNEVCEGDVVLSYNLETQLVESDVVEQVHDYPGPRQVYSFKSTTFDAVCTPEHKWVYTTNNKPNLVESSKIFNNKWPDYPILRVADNGIESKCDMSDNKLKLLGWLMTDGSYYGPDQVHHMHIYQSVAREKGVSVFADMITTLEELGYKYTDSEKGQYHSVYIWKNEFTEWVRNTFPNRVLTHYFVSLLSQHQSVVLLKAMMDGDGTGTDITGYFTCSTEDKVNVFQHLCFKAGYASNCYKYDDTRCKHYGNVPNKGGYVQSTKPCYRVCVLKTKRAHVYPQHKSVLTCGGVWCVTTRNHTWVARRNGKVYVTGNSIIQGSAADLTKMAILALQTNERWNQIGGRLLVPVHDELICEVPVDFYEEGREILKQAMEGAGSFLPFSISCDVETTLRWYGLEYPCPYDEPKSFSLETLNSLSESEVSWIQYHLTECEYQLPKFPDKDGNAPIGNAAKGVNGQVSEDMVMYITDYMKTYSVTEESFINHIEHFVQKGTLNHEV